MDMGFLTRQVKWDSHRVDPSRPALSFENKETWTYEQLHARANRAANGLLEFGVAPGDRVGILMFNALDYWALYLGVTRMGAVAVRLNFRLTREELEYIICDSGCVILCADQDLLLRVEPSREALPVRQFFSHGDRPDELARWARPWSELWSDNDEEPAVPLPNPAAPAMIMYTSGTTGRPKGAVWSHANTAWFAAMQAIQWQLTPDRIGMTTGPLYHVGAIEDLAIALLAVGGHVVLTRSGDFSIRRTIEIIEHHRVTDVLLLPFMIYQIIEQGEFSDSSWSSVKTILSGGDPVLPYAIEWVHEHLPSVEFVQIYGLTEGTPIAACSSGEDALSYPESVGRPMPFTEITIRDHKGAIVATGNGGEIWTRSPVVCQSYWQKATESSQTFVDGWCRTGDTGFVNDHGMLIVSGREKDMIRSGGENIYAAEVEGSLIRHPRIQDVSIIGIPDKKFTEVICAVIVRAQGASLTADEIIAYSREHLAGYKAPRKVVFVEELPRTASGKVLKYKLREQYS